MTHETYEDANHVSVQDAVACAICNPRGLSLKEYTDLLDRGLDARFQRASEDEADCGYRVIRYSDEHIHVVTEDDNRCYLSRNWNRCTANFSLRLADCLRDGNEETDLSYYDGNHWTEAPLDDSVPSDDEESQGINAFDYIYPRGLPRY